LLLRAALGTTVLFQSGVNFVAASNATTGTWIAGILCAASGALLIVGLVTPCAAALLGVLEVATHVLGGPPVCGLAACNSSTALVAAVALALAILGPGAWSVDARLFGMREIIIPPVRPGR